MGDFHEPYGAIVGEFGKSPSLFLRFCSIFTFSNVVKLYGSFSYSLAKALQDVCNLQVLLGR